ncbi:MAG: hypothetical protein K9N35_04890 [Candidatus Marinimicrobia bacterium]|nr:hypothetical protein [Candidatus Neomarinimicrobiota bacterium]
MADIDFANADSRMKFLQENLSHLMNGIDKNYGQVLMDELMLRLEQTVSEFNEEVKSMLSQLQKKKSDQQPDVDIFASSPQSKKESGKSGINLGSTREGLSEFEKRLESLDK